MLLSTVLALLAASASGSESATLVHRLDLRGCDSTQAWGVSAYAVSPDAQTAAVLRHARRDGPSKGQVGTEAPEDEIALLDLRDGREIASGPQLSCLFPVGLSISRDGRTVVALRKLDDTMYSPYGISVWKPYSDPQKLREYSIAGGSSESGQKTQPAFASFSGSPPVISPDGGRLAAFCHVVTKPDESTDELGDNAIGVLDLETGKVAVMRLPIQTPVGPRKYWCLGWGSDNSSLYAVLHGTWSDEPQGKLIPGKPVPLPRRPELTLYRFSLATRAITRVGLVPPTTMGFGPDEGLIVADTVREGWGPHKEFALLPIVKVEQQHVGAGAASLAFAAGLQMKTVVGQDDPMFVSFLQVFVGQRHTYAEVEKKGKKGCTALVERITGSATQKE